MSSAISPFFESAPSPIPISIRLVNGDHAALNAIRVRLANIGEPSSRGEVLRVAVREGLEVLQARLDALEAAK